MVTRSSQALQVPYKALPEVMQVGAGNVAPDRSTVTVGDGGQGYQDQLIQGILNTGQQLATQGFQTSTEEAYLAGQAKAGQIETEEQLQSSPLTRDWAVAGYRDTTGRLKIADAEAQFKQDLTWLRQESPEKLNEYLAKRRSTLAPMLEGMSREGRVGALGQLLLNDRAAIATHTASHVAWQREVITQGYQQEYSVALEGLNAAQQLNGEVGVDQTRAAVSRMAGILARVSEEPRLEQEAKENLIVSGMEAALASDNTALAAFMRGTGSDLGETPSEVRSIFGRLSLKSQEAISKAEYTAKKRVLDKVNFQKYQDIANINQAIDEGTFTGTRDMLEAVAADMVKRGLWSGDQYESHRARWDDKLSKQQQLQNVDVAYVNGQTSVLAQAGVTEQEAMTKVKDSLGKQGMPMSAQVGVFLRAGNAGHKTGYKVAGEIASRAVSALANPDGVNPERKAEMVAVNNLFSSLEGGENGPQAQEFLSGMDREDQARFLWLREKMRSGTDPKKAIDERMVMETKWNAQSPSLRAAGVAKRDADANKILQERFAEGADFVDRIIAKVPFFGTGKAAQIGALPVDNFFGGLPQSVVEHQLTEARDGLKAEVSRMFLIDPDMDAEKAVLAAEANLANRSLRLPSGSIITFPERSNASSFFGGLKYNSEEIAKAIDATVKPETEGGVIVFTPRNGSLTYQEVNPNGQALKSGTLRASDLTEALEQPAKDRIAKYRAQEKGTEYTDPQSRVSISFNGKNTAGVSESVALDLRRNLVVQEGVRDADYKDAKGNVTTGVGIYHKAYLPKKGPDGRVSRAEIEASFKRASEDALRQGELVRQKFAFKDERAVVLFAEMTYQAGPLLDGKGADQYFRMLNARTPEAAVAEFRKTGVYAASGEKRRTHYEGMINKFWKGR